jgi:hypothetical protein
MEMWVVYDHPKDAPHHFVARKWEMKEGMSAFAPTDKAFMCTQLEPLRQSLPIGLVRTERDPNDDPCILETWL